MNKSLYNFFLLMYVVVGSSTLLVRAEENIYKILVWIRCSCSYKSL